MKKADKQELAQDIREAVTRLNDCLKRAKDLNLIVSINAHGIGAPDAKLCQNSKLTTLNIYEETQF